MNIYDKNGWLDLSGLYLNPLFNFYVVIGSRQVGKTFSTSRFVLERLDHGEGFLWLRRTEDEVFMLQSAPENNPFFKHDKSIFIKQLPKTHICGVYRMTEEEEEPERIGYVAALSTIKNMRGFEITGVDWLVYDEFIPERHVRKFRAEGDAFMNAYTTISGNRELEGREPLKAILLSNSNDLSHDVLYSLGIIHDVEEMERKNQEVRLLERKGLAVILPRSERITGHRKRTALARVLSDDSEFWQMAYDNNFAYNSDLYICPNDPASLIPYCKIGKLYFYQKKGMDEYYCSLKRRGVFQVTFPEGQEGIRASIYYSFALTEAYHMGRLFFEEYTAKKIYVDMFNVKL